MVGHTTAFVVAARTAGVDAPLLQLLPLALLVLAATSVPTSIGGWGLREGVAAAVFAAAGLGAATGVATAVVYGVMVLVSTPARAARRGGRRATPAAHGAPPVPRCRRRVPAMAERPYTLLSCSVSIDGYLDSATDERLLLSNEADLDRVDAVRASSDAILVGAATVRNDNPRLLVRSPARQDARVARGQPPSPVKVTVTGAGELDPCGQFFTAGRHREARLLRQAAVARGRAAGSGTVATVVDGGPPVDLGWVERGPARQGRAAADGRGRRHGAHPVPDRRTSPTSCTSWSRRSSSATRGPAGSSPTGGSPGTRTGRAKLAEVRRIDDVVLLRYALSDRFRMD